MIPDKPEESKTELLTSSSFVEFTSDLTSSTSLSKTDSSTDSLSNALNWASFSDESRPEFPAGTAASCLSSYLVCGGLKYKNSLYLLHEGTGKIFSFDPDGSFTVYDHFHNRTWKRGSTLQRFPQEYQDIINTMVLGKLSGSYSDFEINYGPLIFNENEVGYVRDNENYSLLLLDKLPNIKSYSKTDGSLSAESYQILIEIFETYYPSFEARHINWESWKTEFQPEYESAPDAISFFDVMTNSLAQFEDLHIKAFQYRGSHDQPMDNSLIREWEGASNIIPSHHISRCQGIEECDEFLVNENWSEAKTFLDLSTVKYYYDGEVHSYATSSKDCIQNSSIIWGFFKNSMLNGKPLAYLSLRRNIKNILTNEKLLTQNEKIERFSCLLDQILQDIQQSGGLIFDNRANWGGSDLFAELFASRFATEPKYAFSYKWSASRDGHIIKETPTSSNSYSLPIAFLIDSYVASAGENLTLYLQNQEHVVTLGKPTEGAFSKVLTKELPNGIVIGLPAQQTFDANGTMLEGKPIVPDLEMETGAGMLQQVINFLIENYSRK